MSHGEWPTEVSAGGGPDSRGLDFGQALLHRKWLLFFCAALGLAAGALIHSRTPPLYASTAKLLIMDRQTVVEGLAKSPNINPLDTWAVLICSPRIVSDAIEQAHLGELPSLKKRDRVSVIMRGLAAEADENSPHYLHVSYTGTNQGDCKKVLDAIINAFIQHLEDTENQSSAGDLQAIAEQSRNLEAQLEEQEREYAQFRETSELFWTRSGGLNIHEQRLEDIEAKRSALRIEQAETRSQIRSIEEALAHGTSHEALLLMADQLDRSESSSAEADAPSSSFINLLLPLLTEKQLLVEKVGAKHPDVLALDSRINLTRQLLKEQSGLTVSGEPLDMVNIYLESLREVLAAQDGKLAGMDELYAAESEASRRATITADQDRAHRERMERTRRMLDSNIETADQAELASQVGHVTVDPTDPPGIGVPVPTLVRLLALGGVAGLLVGVLIAFLLEMADQSYRSPDDITRDLGAPVVGHIPQIEIGKERKRLGETRMHPSQVSYHRPGSQMAEAYRAVRTALLSGTRRQSHQLIQVTSPNPGDGKSTLSTNLSVSIARAGKSVLLIDADLRRPNVHKLMGLDNDVGVTSVVEGGLDFDDAIQSGPLPHLDVMTSGPRETNRAELLLSPRFAEMLNALRERYDYVIVNTPPLLAVSDPAAVGAMVDGVILVMRMSKQARLYAVRARETLDLVGARLIGVVVNALGDSAAIQGFGTGTRGYRATTYRSVSHGYGADPAVGRNRYAAYYEEADELDRRRVHPDLANSRSDFE